MPPSAPSPALFSYCLLLLLCGYGGQDELCQSTEKRPQTRLSPRKLVSLTRHVTSMCQNQIHTWSSIPGLWKGSHMHLLSTQVFKAKTRILNITMWDFANEAMEENVTHHMISTCQNQLHIWNSNPDLRKGNHMHFLSTRVYRVQTKILDITMWDLTKETNETNRKNFTMK